MIKLGNLVFVAAILISVSACTAPEINDWPPAPVETSDEVIQQYVDRYALKESAPKVYSEIELKALKILQDRVRYQSPDTARASADLDAATPSRSNERSRAEINAIKRRVSRKYESSHDQRHELRSKYGL